MTREEMLAVLRVPRCRYSPKWNKSLDAAYALADLDAPTTDADAERLIEEMRVSGLVEHYRRTRSGGAKIARAYLDAIINALQDGIQG